MVRKSRSDKKDTTCKRCGKDLATPQKFREHLKRKNPCKPLQAQKDVASSIQVPIQAPIQEAKKRVVAEIRKEIFPERLIEATSDTELPDQAPIIPATTLKVPEDITPKPYITQEEADRFVNPNNRKPGEHFRKWGARLLGR